MLTTNLGSRLRGCELKSKLPSNAKKHRRALASSVALALSGLALPGAWAATSNSVWTDAAGGNLWSNAGNWSPTFVPNNGTNGFSDYNVSIGSPSPTYENISPTIDSLTINAGGQLIINPAQMLTVNGPTVTDNGNIQIDTMSSNATFNFSGNTLITGSGTILIDDYSPNARLTSAAGVTVTQDVSHKIGGVGEIDAALTNNGVVNANSSGHTLYLQTNNMTNNALFEATGGATLNINGIIVTQGTAGQILAGSNSAVSISNASITGGTLNSSTGSTISLTSCTLTNTTIASGTTVLLTPATTVNIAGTFANNGLIQVDSYSANANLNFTQTTTVTGTGSIFLYDNNPHPTLNSSAGATVTLSAGQTVYGIGNINASLVNNGIVNANYSGQSLILQTNAMTNNNLFEATTGGTLIINGILVTQSPTAVIRSDNISGISINNGANISGGTLTAVAGSAISVTNSTFNNVNISTGTQVTVTPGATLNITGTTLNNNGVIQVDTSNGNAALNFNSSGSVTGTGTIFLDDYSPNARITGAAGVTNTIGSGQTIDGVGEIDTALTVNGVINANDPGHSLLLQTGNMSNNNLFEATGGGTLIISGITVTQATAGIIRSDNISGVSITNGANISGGTLTAATGSTISVTNSTFNNVNISAGTLVTITSSSVLNITGTTLNNGGLIQIDTDSGNAALNFNSSGSVTGTGTIFLDDYNPNARITGAAGVTNTIGSGQTIDGVGEIDTPLTVNGTLNANYPGHTLLVNSNITGTGTFQSSNGGTLQVAANVIIGAGGSLVGAGAGSSFIINSGAEIIDNGTAVTGLPSISDNGTLTFIANPNSGFLTRSLYALGLTSGATATVSGSALTANRTLLITSQLNFAGFANEWGGVLNLANNDMDVSAGSLSDISSQLSEGFNNGNWNGAGGIVSSSAQANTTHLTALGSIQNNQSGTALFTASHQFDGTTPGAGDILVKYTYYGDANLDGKVDASDYSRIDFAFQADKANSNLYTGWYNGDFNYDGVINGSDYTLIDNAFNRQTAVITSELATPTAQIAGGAVSSAVPEPVGISLLAIAAIPSLSRRRRR